MFRGIRGQHQVCAKVSWMGGFGSSRSSSYSLKIHSWNRKSSPLGASTATISETGNLDPIYVKIMTPIAYSQHHHQNWEERNCWKLDFNRRHEFSLVPWIHPLGQTIGGEWIGLENLSNMFSANFTANITFIWYLGWALMKWWHRKCLAQRPFEAKLK